MKANVAVAALSLTLSVAAWAQEAPPPPPPVDQPVPAAEPPMPSSMRFRWGVGGDIGYFIPVNILDFGAQAHFGVQLNETLAVFGELGFLFGVGIGGSASSNGASVSVAALGFWDLGVMAEATFSDHFFLAGGPMLFGGGWTAVSQSATSSGNTNQQVVAAGGDVLPGVDVRVGYTFGGRNPETGRRSGFTLSLDAKVMYATVSSVSQSAGSTGASQSVNVGDHQIGITPMLLIGYEAR